MKAFIIDRKALNKCLAALIACLLALSLAFLPGCSVESKEKDGDSAVAEQIDSPEGSISESEEDTEGVAADKSEVESSATSSAAHSNKENAGSSGAKAQSGSSSSTSSQPAQSTTIQVKIYVDASKASNLGYPSCMASSALKLKEGSSVYDALVATGLSIGGSSSYVKSINGLAEKALGGTSGWMYSVNGVTPSKAAGKYILSSGDSVRWYYVESW